MEAPYSEQHVARLLRVLSVCIPRPQLQRRLSAPEVQWVPSRASKGTRAAKELPPFEAMVEALFAHASLAKVSVRARGSVRGRVRG